MIKSSISSDLQIEIPKYGKIMVDISYGGAFFVIVPAAAFGLSLTNSSITELVDAADVTTRTF